MFNTIMKTRVLNMRIYSIIYLLTLLQFARCNVYLTAETAFVKENMTQIFTCSSEQTAKFVELLKYNDKYAATIGYPKDECVIQIRAYVSNCSCVSPTCYKCTSYPLTRLNFTDPWICVGTFSSIEGVDITSKSNVLHVDLRVPIVLVDISGEGSGSITIHEGDALQLICDAPNGIPAANITWFFDNATAHFYRDDIPILNSAKSITVDNVDNTKTVTSTLTYTVTRQNHLMGVYCNASNMANDLLSSRKISLNVIYVPEGSILIANNTYFMIRNSETIQQLQCSVIGGNPLANLFWKCYNGNQTYSNITDRAVSSVTWRAGHTTESVCTCFASHEMDWSDEKNVTVKVLYPPLSPICEVGNSEIAPGTLNVSLSSNLTLNCYSEANPEPNYFRWSLPSGKTTPGSILSICDIQAEDGGSYILSIQNLMLPSVGNQQNGTRNDMFNINVQYSPSIKDLNSTITAAENQLLNYSCNATPGNPNKTIFSWSRNGMNIFEISNSMFLVIENISITDEGFYNCTVENYMEPTGFNGTYGTDSRSIFLDVKYAARIESFRGYNDTNDERYIVDHGDEIQLKCVINGDPQPEIYIKRNDEILASVHSGLELQMSKISSCLEDIGTFTCNAKNELNLEIPSYKTLDVDVKCVPLYPLGYSPKLNVAARSGEDVILTFTVFSNPPPFSALWSFRQDMQQSPQNVTQDIVYISNDNMTTDIRISRIKPDEFGEYSVTVHNTLGSISETFFIIPEGPPEKPSHFVVKEELITDTTAVVAWKPSFNGGYLQTFYVLWRQVLTNNWFSADAGTYAFNFTITELISGTKYEAKMYSSNINGKSGESDLITFSTIETVKVESVQIGVAIISGIVSGVAAMAIAVIIVLIVLRRRSKGTSGRCDRGPQFHEMESVYGNLASDPDIPTRFDEEKNMYGNLPANYFSRRTISLDLLRSAVKELKKEPVPFFKEFYSLQIGLKYQADEAVKSHNIDKNRYRDVYPYDASRVILPGDPAEDYINASYIDGYCQEKRYIAAQGPLDNTVSDLWRMIDAENVQAIVMVTNLIEAGTIKCCQYWSDRPVTYGKCCVSLERIEEYADYVVRHIVYCMEGSKSEKMVKQYHYTAWPDKDVPDSALSIVQFWRLVRNSEMSATSPWLVHCSAGIGRTGTFIALDYLHDQGKTEGSVNIPRAVDALREQRISLVQTKEQYLYLHEALAELHDPIGEIYAVENFLQLYKKSRLHATEDNEFRELCELLVACNTEERDTQIKKAPDGALVENLIKSFDRKILPDDTYRPKLTIRRPGENDFINAIFIPTIRQRNKFILTQCPLENTVVDFIRLLWDHAIKNVVVLESEVDKDSCFWPQEDKPIYLGPFVVSLMLTQMKNKWILQTINISLPEEMQHQEVTTYHVTSSTNWEETLTVLDLLVLVNNLPGPLVVQCRDGFTKSGLFVTLLCISDRITTDREVAIAETVRIVKQRRHSAVTNVDQYRMCYDVIYELLINAQKKEEVKMEYVNMQFPKYDQ